MDVALKDIVDKIRHHEKRLHQCLDELYDFVNQGKLPQSRRDEVPRNDNIESLTVVELVTMLNNNKPYISRYQNDAAKQDEVKKRIEQNKLIIEILNGLGTIEEIKNG